MPRPVTKRVKKYARLSALQHMTSGVRIISPIKVMGPDYLTNAVSARPPEVIRYTGPARIWDVNGGGEINLGSMPGMTTRTTNVSIPWDAPIPEVDDVVEILYSPEDPSLKGKALQVLSVDGGGLSRVSRRMQCLMLEENPQWG